MNALPATPSPPAVRRLPVVVDVAAVVEVMFANVEIVRLAPVNPLVAVNAVAAMLPPVMFPVAVIIPAVVKFPPVMFPLTDNNPPT